MDKITIVCEPTAAYLAKGFEADECRAIQKALSILKRRLGRDALDLQPQFESPAALKDYLRLKLAPLSIETFGTIWLDSQHRLIMMEELFRGSLAQTSVYPREVVRRALGLNAAAVLLYHNHPSGHSQPSRADEHLTETLKQALALVDVRLLDHLVVASDGVLSMAERGLM